MSYKTDRLTSLMPGVYEARERSSLIYKLLDAIGAEHMRADANVKALLKSHWLEYASGPALDALGASFDIARRTLRSGELESDEGFRARLRSLVPHFTGGGTVPGVLGAVRSALGLPFNLDDLKIPDAYADLRTEIEALVTLREFSPERQAISSVGPPVVVGGGTARQELQIDTPTVTAVDPEITWRFTSGAGTRLRLERLDLGEGVLAQESFVAPEGSELRMTRGPDGALIAALDGSDASGAFTALDGIGPAILAQVPTFVSNWRFEAQGALFDISGFDEPATLDPPVFEVALATTRLRPLSFDVFIPYFLQEAVEALAELHNYTGQILVFEGLPPEAIQEVVNQTKAAGVRGNVFFTLNFSDKHEQSEVFAGTALHRLEEDAGAQEGFAVGGFDTRAENHDLSERLIIGGVFDVSRFDISHGFQ